MDADGAVRNIVKEILRESRNRNIQIHENFLTYYVSLLVLEPKWGISSSSLTNRTDVQNFIKFVVAKLENQKIPSMVTLKMQFFFNCNYENKTKMVKKNRIDLLERLKPLETEILDTMSLDTGTELTVMYKKMVYYVTLVSGLGNPTLEPVFKEAEAALKSILDAREMREYARDSRYAKEDKLQELSKLVAGVRLFNRDCEKGGEGIEDLPKLLKFATEAADQELHNTLSAVMDKVNMLTTALDEAYQTEETKNGDYRIVCYLQEGIEASDVEYMKDTLLVYRQYELFIRRLLEETKKLKTNSDDIFEDLKETLVTLHQIVRNRIAIPVDEVFPNFIKLSQIWCQLQDQAILLAKLTQIGNTLSQYVKQLFYNDALIETMVGPVLPKTDAERLRQTAGLRIPQEDNNVEILNPKKFKDIDKIHLQFLGFCGWKLVETQGGLIPGNPNLGIGLAMNMYYVFSSIEAAKVFGKTPERYIFEAINLARTKPELINFLQIKDQMMVLQDMQELVTIPPEVVATIEVEVEAETHPISTHIDPTYKWNVWDLKREAIMLANLVKCKTVSSQTNKSQAHCAVKTQTHPTKEEVSQTKKDNYSNVPRLSNFIFGLRGRKDDKQFIVDLTRPVDE